MSDSFVTWITGNTQQTPAGVHSTQGQN